MPFARLYEWLPEVAAAETRTVIVQASGEQFVFNEMYCDEPRCDCRRVLFQVFSTDHPSRVLATISYGWEPDSFYRKWASFPLSDDDLDELRGPGLMRFNPQSERSEEMLDLCRVLLQDDAYRDRIVRHYRMFRELIDGGASSPKAALPVRWRSTSRKRNKARKASR